MATASPGTEVCPFCGKAFKRLKAHLPHCKMTKNMNGKSNFKKTEVSNVFPQSELNTKLGRNPEPPKSKIAIKANSGNAIQEGLKLKKQKKLTNVGTVIDEAVSLSEQMRLSSGTNESQSMLNAGGLIDNVEQVTGNVSQRSNPDTTKRTIKEMTKKKTKANEDFLKQERKNTVIKSKGKTRTKLKGTQKIPNDIRSKERDEINKGSNEKSNVDQQMSKDINVSEVTSVSNLERIQIRPEFEMEASMLELQSYPIILKSSYLRSKMLNPVTAKNLEGCQSDFRQHQNQLVGNIANELISEQRSVMVNKTNVWDHIKENLYRRKLINNVDQEFILTVNANAKESDYKTKALETSYNTSVCNLSTGTDICRVNVAASQVNFQYEGRPHACYVANMRKTKPGDLDTDGLAPPESLLLQPAEKYLNRENLLPTGTTQNEDLNERINNSCSSVSKNTGIGMEWFPELYPGYRSVGLSMLPVKAQEWDIPLRPFVCKNEKSKVSLSERHLMHVTLNELPSWLAARDHSPKGLITAVQRGYDRYYNKYINVKRGSFGGVTMLLVGYATLSYIWSYNHIKHHRRRKFH
uniref:Uncharacterized protein n=1 Tax=Callorhinchus milii TaxID=7868 RepID=A0A4W3JPR0_CALMI|eukprot:gi/632943069/ref/XP_007886759.1/ PREDICTED: uncharacterized protein C17orf80 homolog [Callorhinchus milii]